MNLVSVRVIGSNPLPINRPEIGALSVTRVTILNNDDANGIWAIYSNSPNAIGGNLVLVQERAGLSVSEELIIERRGKYTGWISFVRNRFVITDLSEFYFFNRVRSIEQTQLSQLELHGDSRIHAWPAPLNDVTPP